MRLIIQMPLRYIKDRVEDRSYDSRVSSIRIDDFINYGIERLRVDRSCRLA